MPRVSRGSTPPAIPGASRLRLGRSGRGPEWTAVTFPADIPEITAVGGTEFNESGGAGWNAKNGPTGATATGYLPEKGWNDTAASGGIWASGGLASVSVPETMVPDRPRRAERRRQRRARYLAYRVRRA